MTYDHDNPREEKTWITCKKLPADQPVKLTVLDVTPTSDDDNSFYMNCMIEDGKYEGKTTRIYWWRNKKSGKGARSDFIALCKALLPDRWRNSETIHSFHFKDKCFQTTPKDFSDGAMRLFIKVQEIELDVRD